VPESYDVTTPLGQHWCDTPEEVRDFVDAYMSQDGATLSHVTVVRLRDQRGAAVGEPVAPGTFWP
jgi:hypothetical protein